MHSCWYVDQGVDVLILTHQVHALLRIVENFIVLEKQRVNDHTDRDSDINDSYHARGNKLALSMPEQEVDLVSPQFPNQLKHPKLVGTKEQGGYHRKRHNKGPVLKEKCRVLFFLELICLATDEERFLEEADGGVVAEKINHDKKHEDASKSHFKKEVLIQLE